MDVYKLRVRIGPHEFEAEGPRDSVVAQFEAWKELVASLPSTLRHEAQRTGQPSSQGAEAPLLPSDGPSGEDLRHVFDLDEKRNLVTLRVQPAGERRYCDAILLVLYGYRRLRDKDEVQVTRLKAALESSGLTPGRIDRAAEPYRREGLLIKSGLAKGGKYRLTNKGSRQAEEMIRGHLSQLT